MRTFIFTDGRSSKFWNIDLRGTTFTVTFGRIGTAGQTQVKSFSDEARATKEHDKLISEKLKKGYQETTPARPQPRSLLESLEMALVENPDDLASHSAYADYLTDQGDPRGDFIRVQLALEDATKTPAQRKKLQQQEEKLLKQHQREWLGDLAPYLLGEIQGLGLYETYEMQVTYTFVRGWLHSLEATRYFFLAFTRALAQAPQLRLLRRLVLQHNHPDENNIVEAAAYEPGDDVPEGVDWPQLYPLAHCPYLTNVRQFVLGEMMPPEQPITVGGYESCFTHGEGVPGVVRRMPKLEELYLLAHYCDPEQLYSLPTLHQLRVLMHYHDNNYPLARLAANPSLAKLTHLLCYPHTLTPFGEQAYLRLDDVRALVRSRNLPSLKNLRLRQSDLGDEGAREIAASGILRRLEDLDLIHGRVGDEGARALAACPDLRRLRRLDLTYNRLTAEGIQVLQQTGVPLTANQQWEPIPNEGEEMLYLGYGGDME